jgi:hypothetical protein
VEFDRNKRKPTSAVYSNIFLFGSTACNFTILGTYQLTSMIYFLV